MTRKLLSRNWDHPGALILDGCSLEEFEQQPGCSFAPSAAYLRSLLSEGG